MSLASQHNIDIKPVRLTDIEISGGLNFFLQLTQQIDLFDSTQDPVNRLIQSIKHQIDAEPENDPDFAPSVTSIKSLRNRVIAIISAISIVGILYATYSITRDRVEVVGSEDKGDAVTQVIKSENSSPDPATTCDSSSTDYTAKKSKRQSR